MNNVEVNENRAVEAFLKHENGGLPSSKLTLVFARSGVGKSSFAVNFGLDYAMRGKRVLHFSVGMTSERVHEYYHEVFNDLVKTSKVDESAWAQIERKFTVITYIESDNLLQQMEKEIQTLTEDANMNPCLIIVDGINFHEKSDEKLKMFETIAEHQDIPVLMTLRIHRDDEGALDVGNPLQVAKDFTNSIFILDYENKNIVVRSYTKDADQPIELPFYIEPHTMLLNKK